MCRTGFQIAIALGLGLLAAVLINERIAFAQSGSTGGTLGNRDKSISGSESQPDKITKKAHRASRSESEHKSAPKIFDNPTINGIRIDHCLHFASDCDEPAATAWCRSKGRTNATSWRVEPVGKTIIQSDSQTCSSPLPCGAFAQIVCE
jgi:hypothetical protein